MTIPVVFSTDQNYLFYVAVAIASLAQNAKKDTLYEIYILRDEDFHDYAGILEYLQKKFANVNIREIVIDKGLFKNVIIHNTHISKAAFYRLMIADVIPLDKCVYMDADTLAEDDLTELWNNNLDEFYIGGCKDIWIDWLTKDAREERRLRTGVPSLDTYINSGVLLFNLKKIREDKINVEFQSHLSYDYAFEDQDIINVCCYGKIMLLPEKWNRYNEVYGSGEQMRQHRLSMDSFLKSGGIIHFTNKAGRPWETFRSWKCKEWWDEAKCLDGTVTYKKIRNDVSDKDKMRDFDKLCDNVEKYSKVVIWGYTLRNSFLCEWLAKRFTNLVFYFADRDIDKQGGGYNHIKVLSPNEAYGENTDCLYIVTSRKWREEICDELLLNGIPKDTIYNYEDKNKEYYRMLDDQFYDLELQEIYRKEVVTDDVIKNEWRDKYYLEQWIFKEKIIDR